jgi:hypothetical protein
MVLQMLDEVFVNVLDCFGAATNPNPLVSRDPAMCGSGWDILSVEDGKQRKFLARLQASRLEANVTILLLTPITQGLRSTN